MPGIRDTTHPAWLRDTTHPAWLRELGRSCWNCSACTFLNPGAEAACSVCGTDRPAGAKGAAPAPLWFEFIDTDGDLNRFVVRHGRLFYEPTNDRGMLNEGVLRVENLQYSEKHNILFAAGWRMSFREQGAARTTLLRKLGTLAEMAGMRIELLPQTLRRGDPTPLADLGIGIGSASSAGRTPPASPTSASASESVVDVGGGPVRVTYHTYNWGGGLTATEVREHDGGASVADEIAKLQGRYDGMHMEAAVSPALPGGQQSTCTVRKGPSEKIGVKFEDDSMLLTEVRGETAAERAGMRGFIGRRLTHVNGVVIRNRSNLARAAQGAEELTLCFEAAQRWDTRRLRGRGETTFAPEWTAVEPDLRDVDYVDEKVEDTFKCGVCLSWLVDPVQCGEEHLICRGCVPENNRCPTCRDRFPAIPKAIPKLVTRRIDEVQVRCQESDAGCEWTGPRGNLREHLHACPHAAHLCGVCGAAVRRRDRGGHCAACPGSLSVQPSRRGEGRRAGGGSRYPAEATFKVLTGTPPKQWGLQPGPVPVRLRDMLDDDVAQYSTCDLNYDATMGEVFGNGAALVAIVPMFGVD